MLLESLENNNTKKRRSTPAFFVVLNKCTNTD